MAGHTLERGAAVRAHFAAQAAACDGLGSPFQAGLCRALAACLDETTTTGCKVLGWPGEPRDDALALRLCGALHALVLADADRVLAAAYPPRAAPAAILAGLLPGVLERHDARLAAALDHPPQTNEVGRAAMLLPGFLAVARETGLPLGVSEIGASAGLNLLFDRFRYRFGDRHWGEADSPVLLEPEMRGGLPPLDGELEIAARRASDIRPVHLADPAARLRLRSFVWPDQPARLGRLDAAIGLAAAARLRVEARGAADAVRDMLDRRRDGIATVLFHSIMWQYLPDDTRVAVVEAMLAAGAEASAERPLAWLRLEPLHTSDAHATLALTAWPGAATRHLARCDYHGRWMDWLIQP